MAALCCHVLCIDLQYQRHGQLSEWKLPSGLLEADMPSCRQSDGLKAWRALQVALFSLHAESSENVASGTPLLL